MKKFLYFALYFSEGAPIGFIWWALPAILAERGWEVSSIAQITAVATIPWSLKFLFSPFIEYFDLKFFRLKYQLMLYQFMMGVTCFVFGQKLLANDAESLIPIIFLHALFAAAQDVCIDTLAIKNIQKNDLGKINGFMQAGMLLGRSLFGGVSMLLVHSWGVGPVFLLLTLAIWSSIIMVFTLSPENKGQNSEDFQDYLKNLIKLLSNLKCWLLIVMTFLAGYSFEGLAAILSATLVNIGMPLQDRTVMYSIFVPTAMGLGALCAGYYTDKVPKARAFIKFLIANAVAASCLGLFIDLKLMFPIQLAMIVFYFTIGLHTASLYAYLMEQTIQKIAAFQFSLFMAMTNFSESSSAYLAGSLSQTWDYLPIALFLSAISLLSLFLLKYVGLFGNYNHLRQ